MATQTTHFDMVKQQSAEHVSVGLLNDNFDIIDQVMYNNQEKSEQLADEYNAGTTYNVGDYVRRENYIYKCNTASTTGVWDSTKWDRVKITDELGGGGGSSTLAGLNDVDLSSPTDGQVLGYNGTTNKWENVTGGGGGGSSTFAGLNDVNVTGVQNGDIARYNSTTGKWTDSSDLTDLELTVADLQASVLAITDGHTIIAPDGTAMAQEDGLQIVGSNVADDNANGKTVVTNCINVTQAEYDALVANDEDLPDVYYNITDAQPVAVNASNLPYSSTQSTKQKIDEVASSDATELIFTPVSTVTVSSSTIKRDGRVKMCLLKLDITNISNNTETKIGELSGFISGQYYVSGAVVSAYNTRAVGSFVLSGRNLYCRLLSDATASEKSNVSISIYSID